VHLTTSVIRDIVRGIFYGENYRYHIVKLIDAEFFDYVIEFFQRVVQAKLMNTPISIDWYRHAFLNDQTSSDDFAIHSGLNKKTVENLYGSARREVLVEAGLEHYEQIHRLIDDLSQANQEMDIRLTLKFRDVSVDLSITESLIVINTLAVKRAALRGGAWSTAGKQVEKPLMHTLCVLFGVPSTNYAFSARSTQGREVDFLFQDRAGHKLFCEVKLMGKGNPESADVTDARDTRLFVADMLSELNKAQLAQRGIQWVELSAEAGWQKFATALTALDIPFSTPTPSLESSLDNILSTVFSE